MHKDCSGVLRTHLVAIDNSNPRWTQSVYRMDCGDAHEGNTW